MMHGEGDARERTFVDGRYRVLAQDGRAALSGPLAQVYHARDVHSGREVALKRFLPQYSRDGRFAIRFREQLKRLAGLEHPSLVAILDYGLDGESFYIASEWVEGIHLHTYLAEYGAFSPEAAVHVTRQICAGLGVLHAQGLVHRGLKPENVFLTSDGQARVADATLSMLASESGLSQTTVMMGAVDYMSPEQARGRSTGPAADIYSLGVILFEMLTDQLPFEASDSWTVVRMHAQAAPPSPRQRNRAVSPQLAEIVVRALQKFPEERYATVQALDEALAPLPQGDELLWLITPRHAYGGAPGGLALPFDVGAAAKKVTTRFAEGARQGRRAVEARAREMKTPRVVQDLAQRRRRLPFGQQLLLQFVVTFLIAFVVLYLLSGAVTNGGAQAAAPGKGASAKIDKSLPLQDPTPTLAPTMAVVEETPRATAAATETPPAQQEPTATPAQAPVEAGQPGGGAAGGNGGGGSSANGNSGNGPPPHAGPPGGPPGLSDGHPGRGRGGKP